ncbi:hypothetical protein REPUB_Repub13aG0122100 [Reevesia pubescens]
MEELKDLQSDLEALRELYGFLHLQCRGDVASNVQLGERSKLLLKNLLDAATKRVLEMHKKIMEAAERGVCGTSCSSESEKAESNHPAFSSLKDEDSLNKLRSPEVISQQSRLSFSLDKPQSRKKHSEFMKQQSSRILSKDSKKQVQRCDPLGYFYQASGDERKLLERNEKTIKALKSNETMRQSSILGLQSTPCVVASVVGSSTSPASRDDLVNANQDEKQGEAVNNLLKDVDNVDKHIESHISALRLCSKLADATKGVVSMNNNEEKLDEWNVSLQTTACYVHGLSVPIKQADITKRPSMPAKLPCATSMNNNEGKESTLTIAKLRSPLPSQSTGSKASVRPINMKKSQADHEIQPEQIKGGMGIFRNKILLDQQESEESASAGSDESCTAGSGNGSNDSEAYSLLSQDSESSIFRRFEDGEYEESSSSTTTSSDYRNVSSSGRLYPTRTHKPIRPANTEPAEKAELGQRLGRLRRFKNKLGLIFHHHHHHHHHHGHDHDHGDSGDHSQGVHTKSTWTPLHKLFHNRNRYEVDNILRKTRVSNVPVKHQVGHFHTLMEGLMQHLRHSKKSKRSKGGMGRLGKDQHGQNNRKVKQEGFFFNHLFYKKMLFNQVL